MAHCLQRRSLGALETVARWALLPPGSWPKPTIRKWCKTFSKCQLLPREAPFYQVYEVSQSRFLMLHEEVERDASENEAEAIELQQKAAFLQHFWWVLKWNSLNNSHQKSITKGLKWSYMITWCSRAWNLSLKEGVRTEGKWKRMALLHGWKTSNMTYFSNQRKILNQKID